jgi:hypothetical protein
VKFGILDWLAEPKSDRTRHGIGIGCFGTIAFAIPLFVLVLAFASIAHCKTCSQNVGTDLSAAAMIAGAFGVMIGILASFAQPILARYCARGLTIAVLLIGTIGAAYLSLSPALRWITG